MAEILCIIFLTSELAVSEIIVRSAAFGAIASIDNFYADSLPYENKIKGSTVTKEEQTVILYKEDSDEDEKPAFLNSNSFLQNFEPVEDENNKRLTNKKSKKM